MTIRCADRELLALATLAVLGCSPDRPTAPNDQRSQPGGPAANIEDLPTTAPILYDQRSALSNPLGAPSGSGSIDRSAYLADDFVVPAGETWRVTQVVISASLELPTLPFAIRANNGNEPGAVIQSFSLAPTASDANPCACTNGLFGAVNDYLVTLPTSVTLAPGTYWLTVGPIRSDHTNDVGWQRHEPAVGSLALQLPDDRPSWGLASEASDGAFVLFGTGGRQEQTITFPAITPNPATVGGSATLGATASSGLAVSYTSLTTDVCAVSGGTLTYVTTGACTVAADQAGNATYRPAPRVTQDITVNKGTQTITFPAITPNPATIGGSATLGATASSGLAVTYTSQSENVCTVSESTVSFIAVGTCTVAADQAGNERHLAADQVTQSVAVGKVAQAIAFTSTPPSPGVVGGTYGVSATGGASGNPVTFSSGTPGVCTVSGTTVSFIAAGTCTVAANQAGNASYFAAAQATQNVSVVKLAQAITLASTPPSPGYVNGTYTVGATGGASGNPVVITVGPPNVCTVSANVVRFVGVGTCTIAANQSGNTAYEAAAQVTQSVKVDYRFDGFSDPVNNGVLNVAKAGQVIPLNWRLTDANGAAVTTLTTAGITVKELSCALAGSTTDQVEEGASGKSGLQNLGDGYYQLNWKAPASYATSCKTLQLDLGEGSGARTARFAFTK